MRVERDPFDGKVKIWLREPDEEQPPDLTLTENEMNALVIAWLRGPSGPPGPVGPSGLTG